MLATCSTPSISYDNHNVINKNGFMAITIKANQKLEGSSTHTHNDDIFNAIYYPFFII